MTIIDELLRRKALTHELGVGPMPESLAPSSTPNFRSRVNFGLMVPSGAILNCTMLLAVFFGDGLKKIAGDRRCAMYTTRSNE